MTTDVNDHDRDNLTGLPGPDAALAQIEAWREAVSNADGAPEGVPAVHVMLLGLKRFAAINLAYGEDAGDRALAEVAARLQRFAANVLDGQWFAARITGGRFLLAAMEPCSRERWEWLAEELARIVSAPIAGAAPDADTIHLSPRIALLQALPGETAALMLDRLRQALELAEQQPGRRLQWVDGELALAGRTAQQLQADLLGAIGRGEIEVLFQPQFSCADGKLAGAEALARWQHPMLGRIGAGALFTIAERADQVEQLSRHIAQTALAQAARWPDHLRLSLNITPADLAAAGFTAGMAETVRASGVAAARLTLEITEQSLLAEVERSAARLRPLTEMGIRVALDDFGAGFCNFRYLKILPLHYLKLDRSMLDGIEHNARDLAVLRAIVAMAHALDLCVIAEGIESEGQRAVAAAEGCHAWQGYLGARPMSSAAFAALAGQAA